MMRADAEPDQVAGSESPTAANTIKDEVEALSGDIEKLFKRAYGEIPKATDLAEMRAIQATMKHLLHRALKADNGSGASAEEAGSGEELKKIAEERDKLKDALARSKADFLNYQSRASKDLERAEELSLRKYVSELLPILDSMDLTKMDAAGPDANIERLKEALEMTDTSLRQVLTVRGLERIDAKGKPFDPTIHEAVVKRPAGEGETPNTVAEELRAGYLWKGLILRPAQVLVAEGKKG
jgi:molecular chaperone GrpE